MPDIFDEVDEDLRAERARKFLIRYAGVFVAATLLVIAGAAGFEVWKYYQSRSTARVADEYVAAMRTASGVQASRAAAIPAFAHVADEGGAGYRTLARLQEAALKADSGDLPGALQLWDQVAGDGSADRLLRDLASLEWALHQIDNGDPAQVEARLKPLAAPENRWHALAEEAQAMLDMRVGKRDAARDVLKQLIQDAGAPDGVRGRANGLLVRLGGAT